MLFGFAVCARAQDDAFCLSCHNDPDVDMSFDTNALIHSVHGEQTCIDCHSDLEGMGEEHEKVKPVDCSGCHEDEANEYLAGQHAKKTPAGKLAASCLDCHGKPHAIVAAGKTNSPTHFSRVAETCGRCHAHPDVMANAGVHRKENVVAYTNSVHGLAMANTNKHGAVCTDCHGEHDVRRGTDPESPMFWQKIPKTCGKCHEEIADKFARSVHGLAVAEGKRDAPVCTDCHGEHTIAAIEAVASSVSAAHIPETCGQCHGAERIATRYQLPGGVVQSYLKSYHGLASQIGGVSAANCASCHGFHDVLPSSDPDSSINPANLPNTCGKCHEGIGSRLATEQFRIHAPAPAKEDKPSAVAITANVYVGLICAVVGGMFLFCLVDFLAKARVHIRRIRDNPNAHTRFTPWLRLQHALLVTTFILLAYTGFVHKFPDAIWSGPFRALPDGSHWRGLVHRVAGWTFTALFVVHLAALFGTSRGRAYLKHLAPQGHDLLDALQLLRFNLGLGGKPPPHRRFNYAEKAEYWALIWGSIIMILTGVMLIFSSAVLRLLPHVWLEVAQVVHYYEAILATLAIVVWHFYWVIFDPAEYPMNPAWLIGVKAPPHDAAHAEEEE